MNANFYLDAIDADSELLAKVRKYCAANAAIAGVSLIAAGEGVRALVCAHLGRPDAAMQIGVATALAFNYLPEGDDAPPLPEGVYMNL